MPICQNKKPKGNQYTNRQSLSPLVNWPEETVVVHLGQVQQAIIAGLVLLQELIVQPVLVRELLAQPVLLHQLLARMALFLENRLHIAVA